MTLERARAQERGYPDPILPSLEATHANYDNTVAMLLRRIVRVVLGRLFFGRVDGFF